MFGDGSLTFREFIMREPLLLTTMTTGTEQSAPPFVIAVTLIDRGDPFFRAPSLQRFLNLCGLDAFGAGGSCRTVEGDSLGPLALHQTEDLQPVSLHDLDSRGGDPDLGLFIPFQVQDSPA